MNAEEKADMKMAGMKFATPNIITGSGPDH